MSKKAPATKGTKRVTGSPSHPIWQRGVFDRDARTTRPADIEIEWSAEFEDIAIARDALHEAKLAIWDAIVRTRGGRTPASGSK